MNRLILTSLLAASVIVHTHVRAEAPTHEDLQPIVESYVVKQGDTLANLARRYLGPDAAWNTNISINADLPNPNVLKPGQVINIITGYEQPVVEVEEVEVYQAVIEEIFNIVEKNVKRSDWAGAAEGDRLFPLDAVRTLADSSAVLQFDGASSVLVTEYSQIFLRALESHESGVSRSEIEIRNGETELRLDQDDTPQQQIEINVAGTITRPARGADGSNATRTRKVGDDASQVMVYAGSSAVESAGVSVEVETGMGTTAVAGQAPAEPERLLPAPEILPLVGEQYAENITLSWQPVDAAATYRLDVCNDRRCTQPLFNRRGIVATELTVPSLPVGFAYWRVTAVSASGLDGFTSSPGELEIVAVPEEPRRNYLLWALLATGVVLLGAAAFFHGYFSRKSAAEDDDKTLRI